VIEIIVSIFVAAIVALVVRRYRNVFCLPFFWAAFFVCQYAGLLRIHAEFGGNSYAYAAVAFGAFYAGLLAADFLISYRSGKSGKTEDRKDNRTPPEPNSKPGKPPQGTRIKLLFPVLPLNVGLFLSLLAATFVTCVFFSERGIPILSSFPALGWVTSTSGIVNRLMTVFGPGCYASLALVGWAVHRQTGSRGAKGMMYMGLGLAILADALLASKAAAIMVFIWFNILLFYMNKKRNFWKSLLPLIVIVVPVSAAIVAVRQVSVHGHWQAQEIYQIYSDRLTTEASAPVDFIFKYMNRFGPMRGGAFHREVERIEDQVRGRPKTPLLSEYIFDLMVDQSTNATGLSAGLMLYGTGYAEWGLAGLLLYSLLQGMIFGWVHRYLLRQETMNIVMLIFWGAILSYLMSVSGTGTILVTLESLFLAAVPPLVLLLPLCFFFLLPVARRHRASLGRRVSRVPQT